MRKTLGIILVAAVALTCGTSMVFADTGWIPNGDTKSEYRLIKDCDEFDECNAWALAENAHVVVINSLAEHTWLAATFGCDNQLGCGGDKATFWFIGARSHDGGNSWEWVNGDTFVFNFGGRNMWDDATLNDGEEYAYMDQECDWPWDCTDWAEWAWDDCNGDGTNPILDMVNHVVIERPICKDGDGDGYGVAGEAYCDHPETDCDDGNPNVNPGATEACGGGLDEDCDDLTDMADDDCWECTVDADCPNEDGNLCTDPTCDTNHQCNEVAVECLDDGDPCTMEYCQLGECYSACVIPAGQDEYCCTTSVECVDNALCTGECFGDGDCADANACTVDECIAQVCYYSAKDCDDGNECTDDSCGEGGECVNECNAVDAESPCCGNAECMNEAVCLPCTDNDGDGYGVDNGLGCLKAGTDCDDTNPAVNPGAEEIRGDEIDSNCNGKNNCGTMVFGANSSSINVLGNTALFLLPLMAIAIVRRRIVR